jgi:GR25 family glycosyltransferase involved in LPS biosynthesis
VLADSVAGILTANPQWISNKGAIGCFLSHVRVWEAIAATKCEYAVVLEDDVHISGLHLLPEIDFPDTADFVFINHRMCLNRQTPIEALPIWHALEQQDHTRSGAGTDGYIVTPSAARRLISACERDLFFGHVDGRLLRYVSSESDLTKLGPNSWIAAIIRNHHNPRLVPALGILNGFCLSTPLVHHRGIASSREQADLS